MMKRFAYWLLAAALTLAGASASAAELPLGTGDVMKISVYNNPDLATDARVSASGFVTFPLIGEVAVAGLSTAMAEKKIATLLETGGFVKKPQVNIIVTLLQSQQVSVLGQVNRPGRYPIDATRSVLDLVALAGGVSVDGGDIVSVLRKGSGVAGHASAKETVDIAELVRSGDTARNLELSGGDILYVERAPRFYIYGEVQRPGMFRVERNMTVLQALAAGGGLTLRGTERGLRIKRSDASGKLQMLDAKQDDLLQADDVVYVKESLF